MRVALSDGVVLVWPSLQVQEAYKTLVSLYEACLDAVKPGEPLKSVMEKAKAFLESKAPDFLPYLPKNLGSVIGQSAHHQHATHRVRRLRLTGLRLIVCCGRGRCGVP